MYVTDYGLRLPAAAKYEALTELTLLGASFGGEAANGGRALGDFVSSSCCPRLRKLRVSFPVGLPQLVLRAEALEELDLYFAQDLQTLDVTAPNLRVLKLKHCFYNGPDDHDEDKAIRIVAPRLEEIAVHNDQTCRRPAVDTHDLTSVRRLSLHLYTMHGKYYDHDTDIGFWLLEKCTDVEHVDLSLRHRSVSNVIEDELVDLTPFANVKTINMTLMPDLFPECHLVATTSSLLPRFPLLRSLDIRIIEYHGYWHRKFCFCDDLQTWRGHQKISLGSIEQVKISGFTEADEDIDLVNMLFEGSTSIRSMTLNATTKIPGAVSLKQMMAEEEDGDATQTIYQKLMNIPSTDRGRWHFGKDVYAWTCYATVNASPVHDPKYFLVFTRRNPRPDHPMEPADDLDRISALPDGLLHTILSFLPDATAAARTAVLSRRWRRVWIHALDLVLFDTKVRGGGVPGGFAGFLDWLFAQRGCSDIRSLDIYMYCSGCTSPERVTEWIRHAMRRVTKSFVVELPFATALAWDGRADRPTVELPSHGRTASITMYLSHRGLRLPAAAGAKYSALTELRLYAASFSEDPLAAGGRTLGDFVSSCCPRLRKLGIECPSGLAPQLVLRGKELEELHLSDVKGLWTLEVTAPKLRVLKLVCCFQDDTLGPRSGGSVVDKVARIAALRLEETLPAASVQNCPGVEDVDVQLWQRAQWECRNVTGGEYVDLMLEGVRPFGNVRNMVVKLYASLGPQLLVASVSALLMRCPRLRSLCIKIPSSFSGKELPKCSCADMDTSRSHKKNFLEYLGEVKISCFAGADVEMDLVRMLFESSNSIKSMTLSVVAKIPSIVSSSKMGFSLLDDVVSSSENGDTESTLQDEEDDGREMIIQELMSIPRTGQGRWCFAKDLYTWTCSTTENAPPVQDLG
ncbi:hypothetical protein ACP70R_013730 [Stipagrostis hirtigluma subsp. patula]